MNDIRKCRDATVPRVQRLMEMVMILSRFVSVLFVYIHVPLSNKEPMEKGTI